jgi:hypothetical protein
LPGGREREVLRLTFKAVPQADDFREGWLALMFPRNPTPILCVTHTHTQSERTEQQQKGNNNKAELLKTKLVSLSSRLCAIKLKKKLIVVCMAAGDF